MEKAGRGRDFRARERPSHSGRRLDKMLYYDGIVEDITERKLAQEMFRKAKSASANWPRMWKRSSYFSTRF